MFDIASHTDAEMKNQQISHSTTNIAQKNCTNCGCSYNNCGHCDNCDHINPPFSSCLCPPDLIVIWKYPHNISKSILRMSVCWLANKHFYCKRPTCKVVKSQSTSTAQVQLKTQIYKNLSGICVRCG